MQIPSVISFMKKHGERARITHESDILAARGIIYVNYPYLLWFQNSILNVYTWNIEILSILWDAHHFILTLFRDESQDDFVIGKQ